MSWMIYGANGYTGQLVLAECQRLGLKPVLAGRNAEQMLALGKRTGLETRSFALDDPSVVGAQIAGMSLVLHCAGPFSVTSAPMLAACLANRAHYLDITGEIDVFAACHAQHQAALEAGILVMPGVGFDVVPTDCLAQLLKTAMPNAEELLLAFDAEGGPSKGTALSSIEGAVKGGRIRRQGALVNVPLAWRTREIHFTHGKRMATTIPWGDVFTAYISTQIPNIEVYMALPPKQIRMQSMLNWVRPLLAVGLVQNWLKRRVRAQVSGPSEKRRLKTRSYIFAQVKDAQGHTLRAQLSTPNGYTLTAEASVRIAQHVLANQVKAGFSTPSQLLGGEFVRSLSGVELHMDPS